LTAFNAFGFVDVGNVIVIEGDRASLTYVFTSVSQTAAAGIRDLIACGGTFIASDVDNLNDIGVILVAAHDHFYTFSEDSSFFVYAATHGGGLSGNDHLGDIQNFFEQSIIPCASCDFAKHLIFQVLNFCVKLSHESSLLRNNLL
jgi:hypothetical protein